MWFQWVNTALPYLDHGPVLELGFGTGRLLEELSGRGINGVVGLDQSIHMVRIAQSGLRKRSLTPKLVNGRSQNLPFCNHSFRTIASTFPSPYILERQTLLEIWRVLSPGGRLVIIPTAWITGTTFPSKFAAHLFQVTHQAPPTFDEFEVAFDEFCRGLNSVGFDVQKRIVDLPQSKVLCILAEKPV